MTMFNFSRLIGLKTNNINGFFFLKLLRPNFSLLIL